MAARLKHTKHYNIDLTLFPVTISEPTKTMDTLLSIIDAFSDFNFGKSQSWLWVVD